MGRLLIVSNRLPVHVTRHEQQLKITHSAGGLGTGLSSFYRDYDSIWIGWSGIASEQLTKEEKASLTLELSKTSRIHPIFLNENDINTFYYGFCNKTIWPLFHAFTQYAEYETDLWEAYRRVNQRFCREILTIAKPDDTIWIHDFQLFLLPSMLREHLPGIKIGFFLHIPFPPAEIFEQLPWRDELLKGILGADLVGFHTHDYLQHFLASVRRLLGYEHGLDGTIPVKDRLIKAGVFPLGIHYDYFAKTAKSLSTGRKAKNIREQMKCEHIILSTDRLDYTKGILQRLTAYESLMEEHPHYRQKATLMLIIVPSRTDVSKYRELKQEVDERISRINGKFSTIGWTPIHYFYRSFGLPDLIAMYRASDIALVTPLKDGMNLIAKEYIASRPDGTGVLVLSEKAGTARELGEAVIVNPNNEQEMIGALLEALSMPRKEQIKRNRVMQKRLKQHHIVKWAHEFMDDLDRIKALQVSFENMQLTPSIQAKIKKHYGKAKKRLFLLDYDGTLVSFAPTPSVAHPDSKLVHLLKMLSDDQQNEVVIVSGRSKRTLNKWFGKLPVGLSAEHGAFSKGLSGKWTTMDVASTEWKEKILPILELYLDRTPGSLIEKKEVSLAWHYRGADPETGATRASELKDALLHLTGNYGLEVLEGKKVIEIKQSRVNKGSAVEEWLKKADWDFILTAGDDRTDEHMFNAVPKTAYSIKVGLEPSSASLQVPNNHDLRELLKELISHEKTG